MRQPDISSKESSLVYQIIGWIFAVLIILFGTFLSYIQFMDAEWLSRSGCLVVMMGIWLGLSGVIQQGYQKRQNNRKRRNALVRAKAELPEEGLNEEEISKELERINEWFNEEMVSISGKLKISFGYLEVSLLLTGTFLWGFGDLIIKLIL